MSNKITTVLFDLDGTIADTNEIILRSIADTLRHMTGRPWERREIVACWGLKLIDQLTLLVPGIDLDVAIPYYRDRYDDYQAELLTEFPGVRELLQVLQARGYRLGVVTSKKRAGATETLQTLGYQGFFDVVIVEEDTPVHKPAPDPMFLALETLQVTAAETVYLGDNPDDIAAAHAAGVRGIAVAWCMRRLDEFDDVMPDGILHAPDALLQMLADDAFLAAQTV